MNFILILLLTSSTFLSAFSDELAEVSTANARFSGALGKHLLNAEGNVFFSPLSLHGILALSYQGAGGETATALSKTLALQSPEIAAKGYKSLMGSLNNVANITLNIANKVYLKSGYKLKKSFEEVAREQFYSEVAQVDFSKSAEAAGEINGWVENKTNGKIKDLISPKSLDESTRLVLVNALYFKGNWAKKFDKRYTTQQPFYLNNQDSVNVDMMHATRTLPYGEIESLDAKIVQIPYENREFSLTIILPNKNDGIKELEQKLETIDIASLTKDLRKREVELALPKFKIETKMELNNVLKQMGLGVIFSQSADFSGFLETSEGLSVSDVIQKAFIEVNEEGAEAAAATGTIFMYTSAIQVNWFRADHPFLFSITAGNEHLELFKGKLATP